MKVFIAAIGSAGDLNPLLAIGVEMARRGHQVTVLAGDWHAATVSAAGLAFCPVLASEDFAQVGDMARDLASVGGAWVAFYRHAVMPAIAAVYDFVAPRIEPGNTLLIGAIQAIGLRLIEERFGIPLVTVLVQPRSIGWEAGDEQANARFDAMFRPIVNKHRRRALLPPLDVAFHLWMNRETRLVGLFPPWFVSYDLDAREQGVAVDFLLFDSNGGPQLQRELDAFLATYDAPWVFTYGTGNDLAAAFFRKAVDACEETGVAAILLARSRESLPPRLPRSVLALDYVPLGMLLPQCGGIVHHGGIGTCAQALRAGVPQVIVPMAFDQFANATRVTRLGAGRCLQGADMTAKSLARSISDVLKDQDMALRCQELCADSGSADVAIRCCDVIERLGSATPAADGRAGSL